jgi:hypothetical protein
MRNISESTATTKIFKKNFSAAERKKATLVET